MRGEGRGAAAHALVRVVVVDVNDNPPVFVRPEPRVTVIEEDDRDLPLPLAKVSWHGSCCKGRHGETVGGKGFIESTWKKECKEGRELWEEKGL